MGSGMSIEFPLTPSELAQLKSETGFSDKNIQRLFARFQYLDKDKKGYLTKKDLLAIPEIHFNPVGELIVSSFFPPKFDVEGQLDNIESDKVYFYHFAKNFAVFRPVSNNANKNNFHTKKDKIRFLFDLIDNKKLGKFTREELYDVLEMMIGVNVDPDQLAHIVDRVIKEADSNEDGFISFEEFEKAVEDIDIEQKMAFVGFK